MFAILLSKHTFYIVTNQIMAEKYYTLDELFEMIDEPNKSCCKRIYLKNKIIFKKAKGSNVKHQAWGGGYLDHVRDVMNIAVRLYDNLNICRSLPFSLSDSLLVLYLHDLEKPWKYAGTKEQKAEVGSFPDYKDFIKAKIDEYGFQLTNENWNGLEYIHGEGADYDPNKNVQGPLAAFVHCCDTVSARIWYKFPKERNNW